MKKMNKLKYFAYSIMVINSFLSCKSEVPDTYDYTKEITVDQINNFIENASHEIYAEKINLKSSSSLLIIEIDDYDSSNIYKFNISDLSYSLPGDIGNLDYNNIDNVTVPINFDSTSSYLYVLKQDTNYYYTYIEKTIISKRLCYPGYCLDVEYYINDSTYYINNFPIDETILNLNFELGNFSYQKIVNLYMNTENTPLPNEEKNK